MTYRYNFADRERLAAVRQHIDENFHRPLLLAELSRLALMSRPKLNEGFQKYFGLRVKDYRLLRRMERARWLLQTTDESIEAIAEAVGYENGANLAKVYKRFYGCLPHVERARR